MFLACVGAVRFPSSGLVSGLVLWAFGRLGGFWVFRLLAVRWVWVLVVVVLRIASAWV